MDASECPPTFGMDPKQVVGVIAGGDRALRFPIESAEDSIEEGAKDMKQIGLCEKDVLVAISASGYAPYCQGALEYARSVGAFTGAVVCVADSRLSKYADVTMASVVGAEILAGSTRLKAGTATKMTLNMLTTLSQVGCGRIYQNLMVEMRPKNTKLRDRAIRIVMTATGCDAEEARNALAETILPEDGVERLKPAIVMVLSKCSCEKADEALAKTCGSVRKAVELLTK